METVQQNGRLHFLLVNSLLIYILFSLGIIHIVQSQAWRNGQAFKILRLIIEEGKGDEGYRKLWDKFSA